MSYFSDYLHHEVAQPNTISSIFNRLSQRIVMTVCKKVYQDRLAYVKNWEREKIIQLGLTDTILPSFSVPSKNISLSVWKKEKERQFGLIGAGSHRSTFREDPYAHHELKGQGLLHKTLELSQQFGQSLTEHFANAREAKEEDAFFEPLSPETEIAEPVKNKGVSQFLKDLGY